MIRILIKINMIINNTSKRQEYILDFVGQKDGVSISEILNYLTEHSLDVTKVTV